MSAWRHLFGPVPSRRLGRSLGIDLNPLKVCTEDCVFCQIGRTTELTAERREWVPLDEVRREWDEWLAAGIPADFATLSGNGEPTLHSRFGEVLDWGRAAGFRTALLSNGSLLGDPDVRRGAARADVVKVTISAWDDASFRRLHRPVSGLHFAAFLDGIRRFRGEFAGRLWVEVMLLEGWNDAPEQVREIAAAVRSVRPDAVHLNTLTRPSRSADAGEPLRPVPAAWCLHVAPWFTPRAEIPVFRGALRPLGEIPDAELLGLIARHPMPLATLAEATGATPEALDARLRPLVDAGALRIVDDPGAGPQVMLP